MSRTSWPSALRITARLVATVVLPEPPLIPPTTIIMGRPHEINLKSGKYHFKINRASLLFVILRQCSGDLGFNEFGNNKISNNGYGTFAGNREPNFDSLGYERLV